MQIKSHFDHCNFNVTDLDRSIRFYKEALGLEKVGEINHPDGAFKIVYLSAPGESFKLELTWLRDHPQPYELVIWDASVTKTLKWDFISFTIQMTIGLKFSKQNKNRGS